CGGFNADFDGDQMAVHLPLSYEAQIEASTLMLATNNIFSPANGQPIITPSQDMVLGIYYLTKDHVAAYEKEEPRFFTSLSGLFLAYGHGTTQTHRPLRLRMDSGRLVKNSRSAPPVEVDEKGKVDGGGKREYPLTTMGRAIFNDILPAGMPFYNYE